jgi:RNA methyltransferase, TrmH family
MRERSRHSFKSQLTRDSLITSLSNAKVKHARSLNFKKNRAAYRQFSVEGVRLIEEGERAGMTPALVFFQPERVAAHSRAGNLLGRLQARTDEVYAVTTKVLDALSQAETQQGIVAIYPFPDLPIPASPRFVLILDALRDPGNVGAILRTAWAAGVGAVFLAPGTIDPFNPKIIRSGMGAHFFVPIASAPWDEIARRLSPISHVYLADAHAELSYADADWTSPCALIIGSEASGPTDEAERLVSGRVSITMPGNAESLNAAVAAGILLFEAIRSRF